MSTEKDLIGKTVYRFDGSELSVGKVTVHDKLTKTGKQKLIIVSSGCVHREINQWSPDIGSAIAEHIRTVGYKWFHPFRKKQLTNEQAFRAATHFSRCLKTLRKWEKASRWRRS